MLYELLTRSAARYPDSLAVAGPDGTLTYAELDRAADRYARGLLNAGVEAGHRILIWSDKSCTAVALMQAALRIGAIYVPVAPGNPAARVGRIAEDCTATLVAADAERAAAGPEVPGGCPVVAFEHLDSAADGPLPVLDAAPGDVAYILYTSGSTGTPKGVAISHRNALAFVDWAVELVGVNPVDRLSNHAPFNFDLSVFDLYAAFHAGASVHLIPHEMAYAPAQLVEFLREQDISVWYSVPSALVLMMHQGALLAADPPPALRAVVFAGEPFPMPQVKELRQAWPKIRLWNWYGPTETNVCTSYEVTDADLQRDRPLPIGEAASGDEVYLDPEGGEGEIVVAGPTVMTGYWGREPQLGPYRTGDLGRRAEDGVFEYVGRFDHMVKVRGHRVELGEVEAVLAAHPAVDDVLVLTTGDGLAARLHAVVVAAGDTRPSLLSLKRHCAAGLPTYMIIDTVHVVDAMPRTANGKKDRTALAAAIVEGRI
ncbi:amino acid adenylation domain-containing protein [Catellatospora bangladeshensis]|uniref:D-alanine--poly(Phosphoribitol) ligase n=1 Tax=Catellatospora bangladeshensis TaxID=310355 RepID=A0A8J3JN39_9ACTN|nr:amino acid adenylation domain-containing protein [Catellatospora bangladeshensis]GIF83692.1 D-alanine--poly(phosphoribitol) ligase [Catellatospora bangladeshensis]